jgi:hypothetical protein
MPGITPLGPKPRPRGYMLWLFCNEFNIRGARMWLKYVHVWCDRYVWLHPTHAPSGLRVPSSAYCTTSPDGSTLSHADVSSPRDACNTPTLPKSLSPGPMTLPDGSSSATGSLFESHTRPPRSTVISGFSFRSTRPSGNRSTTDVATIHRARGISSGAPPRPQFAGVVRAQPNSPQRQTDASARM